MSKEDQVIYLDRVLMEVQQQYLQNEVVYRMLLSEVLKGTKDDQLLAAETSAKKNRDMLEKKLTTVIELKGEVENGKFVVKEG
jgi:hypothetical protein